MRFVRREVVKVMAILLCGFMLLSRGIAFAGPLDGFAGLEGTIAVAGGTAHIPVMNDAAKAIMNASSQDPHHGGRRRIGNWGAEGRGRAGGDRQHRTGPLPRRKSPNTASSPIRLPWMAWRVIHPDNPVTGLSSQQVRDIFAGSISNWKEVGGKDAAIHLFTRDEASGTREVFWEKLLKKGPIAATANVVASNGAMKVAISQDKDAIGYAGIGHVDPSVKAVVLDGVVASQENAMNGSYPVVRKLYMNTKGEPSRLVKAFIDYILSPDGSAIIKKHGYIPLQ